MVILTQLKHKSPGPVITKANLQQGAWRYDEAGGAHISCCIQQHIFQIYIPEISDEHDLLHVVLPLNEFIDQRILYTKKLIRLIAGKPADKTQNSGLRAKRLALALLTIDALAQGATSRDIANVVYGSSRVAEEHWKTSPLHKSIIRLCRMGASMMRGEYCELLTR